MILGTFYIGYILTQIPGKKKTKIKLKKKRKKLKK